MEKNAFAKCATQISYVSYLTIYLYIFIVTYKIVLKVYVGLYFILYIKTIVPISTLNKVTTTTTAPQKRKTLDLHSYRNRSLYNSFLDSTHRTHVLILTSKQLKSMS